MKATTRLALSAALGVGLAMRISLALAAEALPPQDYPGMVQVDSYLADPPPVGAKASVFGYPACERADSCLLIYKLPGPVPSVDFSATGLDTPDKRRLLRCIQDAATNPCIAVIYGRVLPDHGIAAAKIWWRSY